MEWEKTIVIVLVAIGLPFVLYFSVKLATVAFYRGRQFFNESTKIERRNDGDQK